MVAGTEKQSYKVPLQRRGKRFTLIELLVVIAVIAILAGLMLPVLNRARERAKRAACMSQLKQFGIAIMSYRQDFNNKDVPWVSRLYPDYVESTKIYLCPMDLNPVDRAASQWLARIDDDWNAVYDRIGNTGMDFDPNTAVGNVSYFYECSNVECTWGCGDVQPPGVTWSQVKAEQIKDYDISMFPVIRCFWHIDNVDNYGPGKFIPLQAMPVQNVGYGGNFFLSRGKWEEGCWAP